MSVELPPPPPVTPYVAPHPYIQSLFDRFKNSAGQSITQQLTMQKQSESNIAHYEGITQGVVPGTGGTSIAKAGSIPMGAFGGGAKSFAGGGGSGGGGMEGPTPDVPSAGSFAMLPIFAIGAIAVLFFLKRR